MATVRGKVHEYYVYILRCRDGSFYTGVTNDYLHRFWQHQEGIDPHCYTFRRRPVELVYVGFFGDINEAISWEKKVKRWSRAKKEALIRRDFEALPKLAWSMYRKRIEVILCHTQASLSAVMVSPSNHGSACHPSTSSG